MEYSLKVSFNSESYLSFILDLYHHPFPLSVYKVYLSALLRHSLPFHNLLILHHK